VQTWNSFDGSTWSLFTPPKSKGINRPKLLGSQGHEERDIVRPQFCLLVTWEIARFLLPFLGWLEIPGSPSFGFSSVT